MDVMHACEQTGTIRGKVGVSNKIPVFQFAHFLPTIHMPEPHSLAAVQRDKMSPGWVKSSPAHRIGVSCAAGATVKVPEVIGRDALQQARMKLQAARQSCSEIVACNRSVI